jgi:hypothetical protein
MTGSGSYRFLRYVVAAGNVVYILWILRNGINEGWRGSPVEVVSYIGLLLLLILNTLLVLRRERSA